MEGRFTLLLGALMVVVLHSCSAFDPRAYAYYQQYPTPQPVIQQPTPAPAPRLCSFNRTRVLIDQQFQVRGYLVYRTCRAEAIINTCASNSCPRSNEQNRPFGQNGQNEQCQCCRPSAEDRWVTQKIRFNCGYNDIKTVQWHTLQPAYCECTAC